jgi:glycosyltransferase involved in cell wall biosynthesis
MVRVLVVGHAPLPIENAQRNYAPGNRTWQFIAPLLAGGHDVCLIAFRLPNAYPDNQPDQHTQPQDHFHYHNLAAERMADTEYLRQIMRDFAPDCVLGVTTLASSIAARLNPAVPLWADLYGSIMAEAQMKASVFADNHYLHYFYALEHDNLYRADKFSTVSETQRLALIGELGLAGRLNNWTTGYEFIHTIPAGGDATPFQHDNKVIRGVLAGEDDFVVLYSGGYNTWTDGATLFAGLEQAMAQNEKLVFVSTGGAIEGHDEYTYAAFCDLIAASAYRERFHLCGWVDYDVLHNYYLESDVAILADKLCYEAELGSRTRILDWLRAGLPAVVNPLAEICQHIVEHGAGFAYPTGDSAALSQLLLELINQPKRIANAKSCARHIIENDYVAQHTVRPFLDWLQNIQFAPDSGKPYPHLLPIDSQQRILAEPYLQSWYVVLQPVWSKLLYTLMKTPLRLFVPLLRKVSQAMKQASRKSLD